jgi:hypothetical protein
VLYSCLILYTNNTFFFFWSVLYCHMWPVQIYNIFPHYLINGTILGKKLLNTKCWSWFPLQLLSEAFLILSKTEWEVTINLKRPPIKYPSFLLDFNQNWIFLTDFRKVHKSQISWKSVQWEPSYVMRTDGRRDRLDEANSRFSQFWVNALKNR